MTNHLATTESSTAAIRDIAPSSTAQRLCGIGLLILATFFVYLPALGGTFILDDDLLLQNHLVKDPHGLQRIWLTTEAIDYWPVSNTAFWLEWRLWGENPVGYHAVNLAVHIGNALLVWLVLARLGVPGAFLGALLFALHPVNVESVAWISQLKTILATTFFLLSILWYLRAWPNAAANVLARGRAPVTAFWCFLSIVAFVLGMLSKASVATLPFVLLAMEWWRCGRVTWRDLARAFPYVLVSAPLVLINIWFRTHGEDLAFRSAGWAERLAAAGAVPWFYLSKALVPVDLAFVYPNWQVEPANWMWWVPLAGIATVTVALWMNRQRPWARALGFAWMFFLLTLAPVMGFVDVSYMEWSLVADHYQYIAIIGVVALVATGLYRWFRRPNTSRHLAIGAAVILTVGCAILTREQAATYRDPETLWQAALAANPDCWPAHINIGLHRMADGRSQEAIDHLETALQLKPTSAVAHTNLASILLVNGRLEEAEKHGQQALDLAPNSVESRVNMAAVQLALGRAEEARKLCETILAKHPYRVEARNTLGNALFMLGQHEAALEQYQQAIHISPDSADAYNHLGRALNELGRTSEAIAQIERALQLKPAYAEAHNNLAVALLAAGRPQEAVKHCSEAIRLQPASAEAHNNLGTALAQTGQLPAALGQFQEAVRLKPNFATAWYNVGNAMLATGRNQEAIEPFEKALQIRPDYFDAHFNLAAVLLSLGQGEAAVRHFQAATQLRADDVDAWFSLAQAQFQLERSAEARAAAEKAAELARSQANVAQAEQIEAWVKANFSAPP